VDRLRDRGDVRRLTRLLGKHDWLVDADGRARDLAVHRRTEAVRALGSLEDPEAEAGVLVALSDSEPVVRLAAVEALAPDPGDAAARALAGTAATWRAPALRRARAAAVDLLVSLDDEVLATVFAETLMEEARQDPLTSEDEQALRSLFSVEPGRAAEVLAEGLAERLSAAGARERHSARQVLGTLGGVAVEPLIRALADPARREAACAALGALRDTRAVPALISLLGHADTQSRIRAACALGEIRDPRALDALVRAAGDDDPRVRDAALDAIGRLGYAIEFSGAAAPKPLDRPRDRRGEQGDRSREGSPAPQAPLDPRAVLRRLLAWRQR
jgi:HEAT repeat protein